ncbi:hypothetical protein QAD02_013587 [Eretmocerus hayati]|uniref:Uncharacterized protein n=1 Tax=Eretmocerus hayati TaxID=131215 RepID=A0ACC2P2J8_9HYME|nr:hypothetical protein QAD02_013587 [Eretmocerus hayati]
MFRQLNEIAAQPPVRKYLEERGGAKFQVIGGKIVQTRYGPSVLLDLKDRKNHVFSSFLSKPLTEVIRSNQQRYERLFREVRGVTLINQGSGKVKFEAPEDGPEGPAREDSSSSEEWYRYPHRYNC